MYIRPSVGLSVRPFVRQSVKYVVLRYKVSGPGKSQLLVVYPVLFAFRRDSSSFGKKKWMSREKCFWTKRPFPSLRLPSLWGKVFFRCDYASLDKYVGPSVRMFVNPHVRMSVSHQFVMISIGISHPASSLQKMLFGSTQRFFFCFFFRRFDDIHKASAYGAFSRKFVQFMLTDPLALVS